MASSVCVKVPATTANIGPGFDCLGAALTLQNQFDFTGVENQAAKPTVTIQVQGPEADQVSTGPDNLVYTAFLKVFEHLGQPPPSVHIRVTLGVPLSRGLGSSATAIVGGLCGANALAGYPLTRQELLTLAIAIEGHPDNVAPALLGSCQLAVQRDTGGHTLLEIPWAENIVPVVAIPNFELSTEAARSVLPTSCSYPDAIFNASHLALLVQALRSGQVEELQSALADRLHQPYRRSLIAHYEVVRNAALHAGAYGLVISGAGPTVLALCSPATADRVSMAMKQSWSEAQIEAIAQVLAIDIEGTSIAETDY
ncbi:homoserine kinase [Lyngbya confervoides]|uniref:Homoserine kinase n=1 Tax=Lyngbya confervoides BDU141951 TaxID=1574623 RepID=A0ABD4T3B5_9CYAN|nr:homoserine kinase [Lyngbya confervoides]MCM1983237.1 homoserine kinase [Lyngbya confervoides BDU141951]